jgi:hypothetical protein
VDDRLTVSVSCAESPCEGVTEVGRWPRPAVNAAAFVLNSDAIGYGMVIELTTRNSITACGCTGTAPFHVALKRFAWIRFASV